MQDTLDIIGAATNTILYDCIPVILYLYGERVQQQWCDCRGYKGANLLPNKLNKKIEPPFYLFFGMQYTFLVFSKLLFDAF